MASNILLCTILVFSLPRTIFAYNALQGKECDVGQGESWLSGTKTTSFEECKKSCEGEEQCLSVTYYDHGGCSHFSTLCANTKDVGNARSQQVKDPPEGLFGVECNAYEGEFFLSQVKSTNFAACKQSCEEEAQCQSVTFYHHGVCSHFSTKCEKTRAVAGAHSLQVKDLNDDEITCDADTGSCRVSHGEECDVTQGEQPLEDSQVGDYNLCKEACESKIHCQSLVYYDNGKCALFRTQCTHRVPSKDATSVTLKADYFNHQVCDTENGEVMLSGSSGHYNTVEECHQSCRDTPECMSTTYYKSTWCSHFSTCCKNRKYAQSGTSEGDALKMPKCVDQCLIDNGGCDHNRACTSKDGVATCGDCPAGLVNDGATECKAPAPAPAPALSASAGKKEDKGCRVTATLHGKFVNGDFPNLVGYTGCQGHPGLHILITHDTNYYKMVGIHIDDAKASNTPVGQGKYVKAGKGSISLNKDTVCKMFQGEGYATKKQARGKYALKSTTVICDGDEGCKVTGTLHGPHVTTFRNLVGYTGCAGSPGLHILIHYDRKHYKMVGVNIKDAKASSTPKRIAKYVTMKNTVKLTKDTACKMYKGEGYKNRVYDYQVKDVTVSGCNGADDAATDKCKTNNGGCDGKRKCTFANNQVTCGGCPAGYTNDGATNCKKEQEYCKVIGTMYGKHVTTFRNLVGYTGCAGSPGLHILIHYDGKHYKMVGVNIKDAKASSTPKVIAKYVTMKNTVKLTKDTACKMYKGKGYKNKVYDYKAKGVTALCGGKCQVRGSMHGKHISTFKNLVGYTGCAGSPGLHILAKYDRKHYKMVGINIKDAKASRTPKVIAKYVTMKNTVKLTNENVCKLFKGEGYAPKVYDYEAKDVTVVCGGSP